MPRDRERLDEVIDVSRVVVRRCGVSIVGGYVIVGD